LQYPAPLAQDERPDDRMTSLRPRACFTARKSEERWHKPYDFSQRVAGYLFAEAGFRLEPMDKQLLATAEQLRRLAEGLPDAPTP
jgi:hypothetical protein